MSCLLANQVIRTKFGKYSTGFPKLATTGRLLQAGYSTVQHTISGLLKSYSPDMAQCKDYSSDDKTCIR